MLWNVTKAQRSVTKEMAELVLKCRQEPDVKSLVFHALEEDVTSTSREVTWMQNVMELEDQWGG